MNDSTSPATRTSQPPVLEPTPVPGELTDALRSARRVALIGHVTPDADCIGALGAMFLALRELGPEPHVAMPPDSVARKLRFLVERAGWQPASAEQLAACDAALVLDTAKPKRVNIEGKLEAVLNARLLVVDHHTSNERFGQVNWVEGDRSSTCEMLYELIATLGVPLTPDIATLLYAGIHSDTQGFSLSNTTCRSLAVAHALAAAGAEIIDTCEKLCRSQSRNEFELLKVIYANTQLSRCGRLGWSTASYEEITAAGCHANDIDNQVEIVRQIEGVRIAILFTEGVKGKIRMNFRGDSGWSVLELARHFGGGGHDQAAGAILDGTIEDVVRKVIPAARAYIHKLAGCEGQH